MTANDNTDSKSPRPAVPAMKNSGIPSTPAAASVLLDLPAPSAAPSPFNLSAPAAAPAPPWLREDVMPASLKDEINSILDWAEDNRKEAVHEELLFWIIRTPILVASALDGVFILYNLQEAVVIAGALATMFILVDGYKRPGQLRNFHHKAFHELRALADTMVSEWRVGMLENEDRNTLAARIIRDEQKQKERVKQYLADAEATLGPKKRGKHD